MSTVYLFKEISSHGALFNALSCLVTCYSYVLVWCFSQDLLAKTRSQVKWWRLPHFPAKMTLILAPTLLSILRKSRFLSRPRNLKLSNDANVWTLTVFPRIYIPSDFTEETCSIGTLSIRSSSVSDRVLNLCLEPINVNSVFVALKVSLLDRSHLLSFSRSWDVMSVSSAYILGMLN